MTLGLISQLDLDDLVRKAADKKTKDDARKGLTADGPTLTSVATSLSPAEHDGAIGEDGEEE